ncbi:hypothetical protein Rsub_13266 [Raphidocelis subcapitata]|uniref:Hemimethylated DNA-binding domain-containing protein n=1 Tax=Raphidocelis subcapitata TaxID=307507 RepID=A0A2V0PQN2_9CHLO|nr:hypothetical protein Rsub_13266 [Raphidocelis subcapitata]|eukprot:GBG00504.1 hypothetical protein Rsub_13266 [Raphidocelis subcapitata]
MALAQASMQAQQHAAARRAGALAAPARLRAPARRPRCAPRAAAAGAGAGPDWRWRAPDWRALQRRVPTAAREAERSALVNEEVVYFIFQLELDAQLQRALNYTAYEAAQKIRAKRETVDLAIRQMQERKSDSAAGAGGEQAGAAIASIDLTSEGLQLRGELQRAVEEERYADAAKYRDLLAELEKRSKQAAAAASEWRSAAPLLRLGQRVVHRGSGYRGAVVGWDAACCEDEEWVERSGAGKLEGGLKQPFYHVLVDVRDWAFDATQPPVAYVAQELLAAPELTDDGTSWGEVYGEDELQHPYSYVLFLGADARGDLVPCRQMRDKYGAPRRDVRRPGTEEEEEGEEGGGGAGGGGGDAGGQGPGGPKIPGIDMSSLM